MGGLGLEASKSWLLTASEKQKCHLVREFPFNFLESY